MSYVPGPIEGALHQSTHQSEQPISSSLFMTHEQEPPEQSNPSLFASFYPRVIGIFSLIFLGYLGYLQTRTDIGDNGILRGVSDIFVLFGSLMCTLWCWRTARQLQKMSLATPILMARRAWIAWICLGGASFSYSIGQAIW